MATGGAPASEDLVMHLTCSLCLDIFTDPKMVPGCLHTYCLKCLEELAAQHDGVFPCPECRAQIEIPAGGVATFQTNRFLRSQDLAKARDGTENIAQPAADDSECPNHPKMTMDLYCADCNLVLCPRCVLKEHRNHVTQELHEAATEAKTHLTGDLQRLQEAVSYMIGELEVEEKDQQALQDKKTALETAIHNRHATMVAMADKCRDDMLTSLDTECRWIQMDQMKERQMKQSNLDTLLQLQQQALQAVSSGKPSQLLDACMAMKDRKGSSQNVDSLKTPKKKFVARPALTFKVSEDVGRKQMKEFMQGRVEKVTLESTSPDVRVKKQLNVGQEKHADVFSVCPYDSDRIVVSYAQKGLDKNAPAEEINFAGKCLHKIILVSRKGKTCFKSRRNDRGPVVSHKERNWTYCLSKSPVPSYTHLKLSHDAITGKACVQETTVVSEDPYKAKVKDLFSIYLSDPQRAFDVNSNQQLFVVLEDAQAPEKRRVHLYQHGQEKAVATYTPPSPTCQPSDVCFMMLEGQEILLVSDEATDSIHVVHVDHNALTFLRYLATDRPLLVQPTALNVDHEGRLWVACRGGAILTMTPIK